MIAYSVPLSTDSYPDLVVRCLRDIRAESGDVALRLVYREQYDGSTPVLLLEFYTPSGRLFARRLNLPPDTPGRTESRMDALLDLLAQVNDPMYRAAVPPLRTTECRE
ncbi:hypothetical protein RX799_24655 [Klebsiella oxytoca]|uniref:hypothetical protein n=1 Tax=Klebsiella oxytoca TaxID=571 RepID=UPI0038504B80